MKSTFTRARILLIILISYTWINEILEILLKFKSNLERDESWSK